MYKLPLTERGQELLHGLYEVSQIHRRMGFAPEQFNHISKYGETLLCDCLGASPRRKGDADAVDIVLPNGQTAQVKTTNNTRKEITCTYNGTEVVDLMIVLELDVMHQAAYILYGGPFKPFIDAVNGETRVMGWDNHRCPNKKLIRELQNQYGLPEFTNVKQSEFFIY